VKAAQGKPIKPGSKEQGSAASDIARIVKIGQALSLFPMIVFALSKKVRCLLFFFFVFFSFSSFFLLALAVSSSSPPY
jgi:hypothetical protein